MPGCLAAKIRGAFQERLVRRPDTGGTVVLTRPGNRARHGSADPGTNGPGRHHVQGRRWSCSKSLMTLGSASHECCSALPCSSLGIGPPVSCIGVIAVDVALAAVNLTQGRMSTRH